MGKYFSYISDVLRRECGRIRANRIFPLMMFVLPAVSLLFFAGILSKGVPRDIAIGILDHDRSSLSRTLVNMFDATPTAAVEFELADMAEGEALMKKARIMAIIEIPPDFEKNILSNTQTGIHAYISGLNLVSNGMLSRDIQTSATSFSTAITAQTLTRKGMSERQAFIQALPIYFDRHVLFNPYTNYGFFLLPSFLPMMLMIFTLILTILAIGSELKDATASRWIDTAGGRIWPALIGKLLPYTLSMFILSVLINMLMYGVMGVPLNGSLATLTISSFIFILAYQSIAILIVTLLYNLRLSLSIGGGYSVLAFTFSGLTFPLVAMDMPLRILSYIFPFTVYTEIFVDQAARGVPLAYSIGHIGLLCLYVVIPLLCLPRLRKISTNERYWGKL